MSRTRFAPFVLCVLLALFASPLALAQDDTGGNAAPAETAQSGPDEAAVAAAVAEAAAVIQAEPPVHERAEPWSVPVSELELEIQPLSKEVIDERLGAWKGLLEQAIRERNRLNIAAGKEEFADIRSELNAEAQEKQVRIEQLKERALLLVELLKDRGGDASEHERYIAQATGQKLNPLDFEQVLAWLQSPTGGIKIALNILRFIAVLFVFWIASRIIGGIVKTAMGRVAKGQSDLLKTIVGNSVRRVVLIIGVVIALGQLGVNIGPLVAAIGAAGLVIGLALQGVLSNFASGILILVNKPYDVGDVISAGGVTGKVERMTLVNTKVLTFDNQIMHVPNDAIWSGVITNITGLATRRVDMVFGIGYADDIEKAERIITEIVSSHAKVLPDPAPTIRLNELADSSVNFIVRPWSKKEDYWDVYWDVTKQVKQRFDDEGIGIPFPQRDLHLPEPVQVVVTNA